MIKLYQKLGDIERSEEDRMANREISKTDAIVKERTGAVRMLTKSMSVDAAEEDTPWVDQSGFLPERMSYIELKMNSETYQDAPLSQTLPASLRIGELIITPGIERLCKNFGPEMYAAAGFISPGSSRKKFLAEERNVYESAKPKKMVSFDDAAARLDKQIMGPRKIATISVRGDKVEAKTFDQDAKKEKASSLGDRASAFFSSVKDKRKMFRKSASIDNSGIGSTVARMGVQVATPAAPATVEPTVTLRDPKDKRKNLHKRAASLELPAFFRTSSAGPSTSRAEQTTTVMAKDTSGKSSKSGDAGKKLPLRK
jgi:hypothetical protein